MNPSVAIANPLLLCITRRAPELELRKIAFECSARKGGVLYWFSFQVSRSALAFQQTETNTVQLSAYAARPARDLSLISLRFLRLRSSVYHRQY
jgi:hypothetical protein